MNFQLDLVKELRKKDVLLIQKNNLIDKQAERIVDLVRQNEALLERLNLLEDKIERLTHELKQKRSRNAPKEEIEEIKEE